MKSKCHSLYGNVSEIIELLMKQCCERITGSRQFCQDQGCVRKDGSLIMIIQCSRGWYLRFFYQNYG